MHDLKFKKQFLFQDIKQHLSFKILSWGMEIGTNVNPNFKLLVTFLLLICRALYCQF